MSGQGAPALDQDADIFKVLTCLPEKFVVDFANGIDVVKDHLRVQKAQGSFYARCYDGFTGQGARRQAAINESLVDGVEASLQWLTELSSSLALNTLATARINERVSELTANAAKIADYSVTTRRQLEALSSHFGQRCSDLEQEVSRIDLVQRVQLNIDQVFNKWKAGRYNGFSLSGRCYAALEELRWGAFGDYCRGTGRQRQQFLDDLTNRAIVQLADDANSNQQIRLDTRNCWLAPSSGKGVLSDAEEALAYMGDGFDQEEHPMLFTTSQRPEQLPLVVPRLCSAERVSSTLVSEMFGGTTHA